MKGSYIKYQYKRQRETMHKSTQLVRQSKEPQFMKGMTLDQYLASYPAFLPADRERQLEAKEQNLQETSYYAYRKRNQSKGNHYKIEEIDQESIEDSIQQQKSGKTRATPFFDYLQKQSRQKYWKNEMTQQKDAKVKINQISLNSRRKLKSYSQQKNSIRTQKFPGSPFKRPNENLITKGNISYYGNQFKKGKKKETLKMTEVLTFYGKLSIERQQEKVKQKNLDKGVNLRQIFKKKNQLQINELLVFENRIKSNYSCGANYREMMVVGVKDRLNNRKQKHFE